MAILQKNHNSLILNPNPNTGSQTHNKILKIMRANALIYQGLMRRYEEYGDFLDFVTLNKEIADQSYQVSPDKIAELTKGIGHGVSLLPDPSGVAKIVGLGVQGSSYLTSSGWQEFNRFKTLKRRRAFLKRIESASRFCGLAVDRNEMEGVAQYVADALCYRYQALLTHLVNSPDGTERFANFLVKAMKVNLPHSLGAKDFADKLISAALPEPGIQYNAGKFLKLRKIRLATDKLVTGYGYRFNHYTLEGALTSAGAMTHDGHFYVRTGQRQKFIGTQSNNRSSKYPPLFLRPDELIESQKLAQELSEVFPEEAWEPKVWMRPPSEI